jgi:chromosome segregation ATPase
MANTQAHPVNGHAGGKSSDGKNQRPSQLDITLPAMDALSEELNRLAAINTELVGRLRGAAAFQPKRSVDGAASTEVEALQQENAELRGRVEELEQLLLASSNEDAWADRQREYEALLEEKSEVIRALHLKFQELQEGTRRSSDAPIPKEDELVQLREELETQRRQLQDDEESLMNQMREMEMALSKDRAELARQRQEVQRLQAELNREAEQAGRDDGLRERLANLRRPSDAKKKEAAAPPVDAAASTSKSSSGLLRRLFG